MRKFLAAVLAIDFLHNVDSLQEPPKAELDDARQYAMPIVRKLDIGPDPKPIRSSRKYRIMSTDLGNRIYDSYMKEATAKTAEATAR